jgi:RNA recognition motif-containing protein
MELGSKCRVPLLLAVSDTNSLLVSRFVSYDSAASAESAIQGLNNVPVGGRRLKVERKRGEENGIQQAYQQQQAY